MKKAGIVRTMPLVLLCVGLAVSGCGKGEQAGKASAVKKVETVAAEEETKESELKTQKETDGEEKGGNENAKAVEREAGKETKAESKKPEKESEPWFERGEWKDGVYSNRQAGISITLPEGWTRLTEEELMQVMDAGYAQLSDEQKKLYDMNLQNQQTVYDLGASGEDGQSSFFFLVQNLGLSPIMARMSEDAYLDVVKRQLEGMQLAYTFGEIVEREIADDTWKVLSTECMGTVQWCSVHKAGQRMETLIITVPESGQDAIEDMLDHVKRIETP